MRLPTMRLAVQLSETPATSHTLIASLHWSSPQPPSRIMQTTSSIPPLRQNRYTRPPTIFAFKSAHSPIAAMTRTTPRERSLTPTTSAHGPRRPMTIRPAGNPASSGGGRTPSRRPPPTRPAAMHTPPSCPNLRFSATSVSIPHPPDICFHTTPSAVQMGQRLRPSADQSEIGPHGVR
jgi:hypothetical protein